MPLALDRAFSESNSLRVIVPYSCCRVFGHTKGWSIRSGLRTGDRAHFVEPGRALAALEDRRAQIVQHNPSRRSHCVFEGRSQIPYGEAH